MDRFQNILIDRSRLCAGAARETVEKLEGELGVKLPDVHKAFLRFADGGVLGNFIFYSAGDGIHRSERLLEAYRRNGPDCPILAVGRDASDDFGFLRSDLSAPSPAVYFMSHETWELVQVAPSFLDFVRRIAGLKPDESLRVDEGG